MRVVLVLSYLLLLRAFRSIILPLKAVILIMLSIGAAYGSPRRLLHVGPGRTRSD